MHGRALFTKVADVLAGANAPPADQRQLDTTGLLWLSRAFKRHLAAERRRIQPRAFGWYPYDSFSSLDPLLEMRSEVDALLAALRRGDRVVDVGCGDGDMSFFMEWLGLTVDAIDTSMTNYNRMAGVAALKAALHSGVAIHDVDLDAQFHLPAERYSLALCFGVLYHLKNPYYVLETVAHRAERCLLSTRVAGHTPDLALRTEGSPLAYLLHEREANDDPTNYWIFTNTALRRLVERAGWQLRAYCTVGNTSHSDPASTAGDERAFCVLRSAVLGA